MFFGDQLDLTFGESRQRVIDLGLLRPGETSVSGSCPLCGRVGRVRFELNAQTGSRLPVLSCRMCGGVEADSEALRQWAIDVARVLGIVRDAANFRGPMTEAVPNHIWHLGRAAWGGCSREAYFLRAVHEDNRLGVSTAIATHPRAVLFFPTEAAAHRWRGATPNPIVGLDAVIGLGESGFTFDPWVVEGRLADTAAPAKNPRPKNEALLANIGRLTEEMVTFLRNAREYAISTLEIKKEAALLPRPSKKDLGELAGLEAYEVTRCFADETARELNLYWEMALDLNQVMNFKGPIGTGSEA